MSDLHDFLARNILWILAGCLLMSITGVASMGADKSRARKNQWRIPESTLIWIAALGGAAGVLLGMRVFHHKTRHAKFTVAVPLLLALQIAAFFYLLVS